MISINFPDVIKCNGRFKRSELICEHVRGQLTMEGGRGKKRPEELIPIARISIIFHNLFRPRKVVGRLNSSQYTLARTTHLSS